jgi:ATP-dependent DNA helicase DinG
MAQAVAEAIVSSGDLVVEAGTGVGKTWAYLAPLLLGGQRAWISTGTQALQDQLFQRDIPALSQALGLPVRAALLKGRSNYVCLHRLELARTGELAAGGHDPAWASVLGRVQQWADLSPTGDLSELPGLDDNAPLRPWISSTRENCLRDVCPSLPTCRVYRARRTAQEADWVVINHHLFLAGQLNRDDALPALLPSADTVIFDEAHRLVELVETQLGLSIGSEHLLELSRELKSLGPLMARGLQPWAHRALVLEQAVHTVSQLLANQDGAKIQAPWVAGAPKGVAVSAWQRARLEVLSALDAAAASLQAVAGAAAPLEALAMRALQWRHEWVDLLRDVAEGAEQAGPTVRWAERWPDGAWRVTRSATDAPQAFEAAMRSAGPVQSWVFTSATLGIDERLSWFVHGLGLQANPALRTLRIPSPFDHGAHASLYVPDTLPEPADEQHSTALAASVARWADILGGRTLVLTTSLRACGRIAAALRKQSQARFRVLAQGEGSKRSLLHQFRATGKEGPGAVMVASASFWEGVDLPGDALQLLVIDKLPFPSPGDPLSQLKAQRARAQGLDPFHAVYEQKAALALKQGAGRLIRSATDRGILVIADRRLLTQRYGSRLLESLPPMARLVDEADMQGALARLVASR